MAPVSISLSQLQHRTLAGHGLRLAGLGGAIRLADSAVFEGPTSVLAAVVHGADLRVGAFCNLSGGTINNLHAGRYCSIANGVVIGSHEHPTDWLTTSRTAYFPQVHDWDQMMSANPSGIHRRKRYFAASCPVTTLGPDVWVGQGAFIKSGVTVGAGAIIGARATVVKDVPPYAIVVGTPGRVLRLRFPDKVVERLLSLQWWRFSIYDLFDAPMDDIERALDVIEDLEQTGSIKPYAGPLVTAQDLADPETLLAGLAPPLASLAS
jgi:acetyltransferase-like isoleucine patch superfamily enzyme